MRFLIQSRADFLALILILGLGVLAYGQVASHGINGLDDRAFLDHEHVAEGLTLKNIQWSLSTTRMAIWHPITWWTYQIESSIFGADNIRVRHIVNLLLHLCSVVICYVFIRHLFAQEDSLKESNQSFFAAIFVTFLFAFHPQHVQVLAWLSERKELLAAMFSMLSILTHIKSKLWWAVFWFCLALMSKASALPMACVIVIYDVIFRNVSTLKKRSVYYVVLLGLAFTAAIFTLISQYRLQLDAPQIEVMIGARSSFYEWFGYIVLNLHHYLKTLFWPWPLPIFVHRPESVELIAFIKGGLSILVALAMLLFFRKNQWVIFGFAWFILFWLPTSGIVNIGNIYVADRYMYQAHIGAFIAIFAILYDLKNLISFKKGFLLPVLFVFAMSWHLAWQQTSYWQNNITFYERELTINPNKVDPLIMLGRDHQRMGDLEKAKYYYGQLLKLDPYDYYGNMYSGFLNLQNENYPTAVEQLMLATQYGKPAEHHYVERSYEGLAWAYNQMGRYNFARRLAYRGLKTFPENEYLQQFVDLQGEGLTAPKADLSPK